MSDSTYFIGLMSGTSMDGVDAVLVDFAHPTPTVLASATRPFSADLRAALLALQTVGDNELDRAACLAITLSQHYAEVTHAVLAEAGVPAAAVRAVGCHGQTVRHAPQRGYTVQLADWALLAELTGIDTIGDFRRRDVAAGGQGAPLVPAFHHALFAHPTEGRVIANIGGIANLTCLSPNAPVRGLDTGPGNMLLDGWMQQHTGQAYDAEGRCAAQGRCAPTLLAALLDEPYFAAPLPKSTGRDLFNPDWLASKLAQCPTALSVADVARTLTILTARTVAEACQHHAPEATALYVCGGGALNPTLLAELAAALPAGCALRTTATLGVPVMQVEALAFAWLARQHVLRQAGNLPAVTGAAGGRVLGACFPA